MASLAILADYELRYGTVSDGAAVTALLEDASSLVRQVAGLTISLEEDDEVTLVGNGRRRLILPSLPVVAVTSVLLDGTPVLADDRRSWTWGGLDRRDGGIWTYDQDVVVVYTHGYDPVPPWIVSLVCSMVQRAVRPSAVAGEQSVTTGSQTVQYAATALGVNVWLTQNEERRLRALRGPTIL